jgi:hypothetical protein
MVVDRYILKRTRDRMTRCGRDRSPWVLVVFYIFYILYIFLLYFIYGEFVVVFKRV